MDKQTILQAVSEVTGVPIEDILMDSTISGARTKPKVFARQLGMYFAMQYSPRDIKQIAHFFHRHRTDVIHSLKTVANDIETNKVRADMFYKVQNMLSYERVQLSEKKIRKATAEDLSEVQYEYQDLTSEALKFQTNQ